VELNPISATGYFDLGSLAYRAGRLEEAVTAFKKNLELYPKAPGPHSFLGRIYLAQGHPQEGLAEIEREPNPIWQLYSRALAYHALGRKKESDASLAEFVTKYRADWAFQIAEVYAFRAERPTWHSIGWSGPTPSATAES